eukprot:3744712-Rhodomonas_salina.1
MSAPSCLSFPRLSLFLPPSLVPPFLKRPDVVSLNSMDDVGGGGEVDVVSIERARSIEGEGGARRGQQAYMTLWVERGQTWTACIRGLGGCKSDVVRFWSGKHQEEEGARRGQPA